MENNNEWLRQLGKDDSLWPKNNHDCNPSVINFEYDVLREMAEKGNLYGCVLQIKDVFELVMKIPCVMGIIIMMHNGDENNETYQKVLGLALGKPMAIGDWNTMAALLFKEKDSFRLPASLAKILKETRSLFNRNFQPQRNIMSWRNETIGHGALRFEDDPSYEPEITSILEMLKKYFGTSLGRLYENLYVESEGFRLTGDQLSLQKEAELRLFAEGEFYPIGEFITLHDLTCFFFNSYYSDKKKAQFSSFIGGRAILERNEYIETLRARLNRLQLGGHSFAQKLTTRGEEKMLELLSQPDEYFKPDGLLEKLNDQMEKLGKGVIMIQMERGTGKSAFANRMSSLHHKKPLIADSFSRIYHLANASLRTVRDFSASVQLSFQRFYNPDDDLYFTEEEIPSFDPESADPSESLAGFLNAYHDLYAKDRTILVLDGIDELTSKTKKILGCIPKREMLEEGVFVILLSRFEDEKTVLPGSRVCIKEAVSKADGLIGIRRNDPDNIKVMEAYIRKKLPLCEDTASLIEKADHRFLYLRAYVMTGDKADLDSDNETDFYQSFLEYLFSFYGQAGQNQIRELLAMFALFPGITLEEIMKYLNMPSLTYTVIGILNDLMPLLNVQRDPKGNQYMQADEAYDRYVLREFRDEVREMCRIFDDSMRENLEDYLAQRAPSYQMIVHNRAVSKAQYFADEHLEFFGRHLLNLYHKSDDQQVLYNPGTLLTLAAVIGHDPLAEKGYRRVISDESCDEIIRVIREGLAREKNREEYHHPLYPMIRNQSASFLAYLKTALSSAPSFAGLYEQYTEMMAKDQLTSDFFWIIDEDPLPAETMELIERKADVNAFIRYFFSSGKIYCDLEKLPDRDLLDEESIRILTEEGLFHDHIDVVFNETAIPESGMKTMIHEAIEELNNPGTDFTEINILLQKDSVNEVYDNLESFLEHEELKEDLLQLHRAFHERLQKEEYPLYLFSVLSDLNPHIVFSQILHALYPERAEAMLAVWAKTFLEKADPTDMKPETVSIDLITQAAEEYLGKGDIENMLKCLEILTFEYSQIRFFGIARYRQICEDLKDEFPDKQRPLLWCTADTEYLVKHYLHYGSADRAEALLYYLNETIPLIVRYVNEKGWDIRQLRYDCFNHIHLLRELDFPEIDETWINYYREKLSAEIRSFLTQPDITMDFYEAEERIREYLYYDVCMYDAESLKDHTAQLTAMFRSALEDADRITKEALEKEILSIQDISDKYLSEIEEDRQCPPAAYLS